jgi:hypothetical protein
VVEAPDGAGLGVLVLGGVAGELAEAKARRPRRRFEHQKLRLRGEYR